MARLPKRSIPTMSRARAKRVATLTRTPGGWRLDPPGGDGLPVWTAEDGRACVTLHVQHPFANSAGWQRLYRFLILESLGLEHGLDSMDHVHHVNGEKLDDVIDNLEVWSCEYHGSHHASATFSRRDERGRFAVNEKVGQQFVPRWGAIIGPAAARLL